MATWNADKPAVGNEISADIPDIEENFQELHDVTEAITNGTLGTTTASAFKVNAITSPAMWIERAKFQYKDADEIYINPGAYHHNGTVSQVVYWSSQLTSDIGSPDASDWYYLYLDDSAIVTAGTNLLTATEFVWSNTEPTYTVAKHGWYNGSDRCIFAVFSDSSSNITEFYHDGGPHVQRAAAVLAYNAGEPGTTWTNVDCTSAMPMFSMKASAFCHFTFAAAAAVTAHTRPDGQTDTSGITIGKGSTAGYIGQTFIDLMTSTAQIAEVKFSSATGTPNMSIYVNGWYFPAGM